MISPIHLTKINDQLLTRYNCINFTKSMTSDHHWSGALTTLVIPVQLVGIDL